MSGRPIDMLALMSEIAGADDREASLASLTRRGGCSLSQLHRRFTALARETPKRFALRVRLERAAAQLLASPGSILKVAFDHGFASHEVFTRAFQRRFGCSPRAYRAAAGARLPAHALSVLRSISPCVRLYGLALPTQQETRPMPIASIECTRLEREQPLLFIRRRIARSALQQTMGECFGTLYGHGQAAALAIAGYPIARYVATGPGLWTVDFAMPLSTPAPAVGEMQAGTLPAGPVAFAVHQGPYEQLPDTNAAVERWIEENGFVVGGAPWEWYVTSPGEVPDPANWRTEVYWPLQP